LAYAGVTEDIASNAAKENQDLFHLCSSNSALTELSRDSHFGPAW